MQFLCHIEVFNLDGLYQDCQDLSTIRGGGLAALKVGAEVAKALKVDNIVASASQGLFVLEAASQDAAEELVRDGLKKLDTWRVLQHGTVLVAATPYDEARFAEQRQELRARLRWRQMQAPTVRYPAPEMGVCDVDLVRPGRERAGEPGRIKVQSELTFERRKRGRGRRELLAQVLGWDPVEVGVPQDFEDLASAPLGAYGNLRDKLAVLSFDGNDFGAQTGQMSPQKLQDFSRRIQLQHTTYLRALADSDEFRKHGRYKEKIQLELLVYGGDEITLVVPAWLGWHALSELYRTLGETGANETYSAGLVFCHAKTPIHSVRRLVGDLVDVAKDARFYDGTGGKGNRATYQVLESFDALGRGVEDHLKERFRMSGGQGVALDARQIDMLNRNMGQWRMAISRKRLHALADPDRTATVSNPVAEVPGLLETKSKTSKKEELEKFAQSVGAAAFVHLLELWDYAQPELEAGQ